MTIDDSFKKPGSVPFKWEIRPGVPKIQPLPTHKRLSPPTLPSPSPPFHHQRRPSPLPSPSPSPSPRYKLKPPPPGSGFLLSPEPRTQSFRSAPRTRSGRWRVDKPARVLGPECAPPGCFPSPLLVRKDSKRRTSKHVEKRTVPEPDYASELDTFSRWSVSSRRSVSSLRDSPVPSYSSFLSSPRVGNDAEWASFGLF